MSGMTMDLEHIFSYPPIMGITINTVALSPQFRSVIYSLIVCIVVIGTFIFWTKNTRFPLALNKSIIAAFFATGILYAFHADVGWSIWVAKDARIYSGLDTDGKLTRMEGGVADFSRRAAKVLGPEYMLFSGDDYLALRTEYFLLPMRKRGSADDIVVLEDNLSHYDPAKRRFTRGNLILDNVEPVLMYAQNAYILRKKRQ